MNICCPENTVLVCIQFTGKGSKVGCAKVV